MSIRYSKYQLLYLLSFRVFSKTLDITDQILFRSRMFFTPSKTVVFDVEIAVVYISGVMFLILLLASLHAVYLSEDV